MKKISPTKTKRHESDEERKEATFLSTTLLSYESPSLSPSSSSSHHPEHLAERDYPLQLDARPPSSASTTTAPSSVAFVSSIHRPSSVVRSVLVLVNTCEKFLSARAFVIVRTWARAFAPENVVFVSDHASQPFLHPTPDRRSCRRACDGCCWWTTTRLCMEKIGQADCLARREPQLVLRRGTLW